MRLKSIVLIALAVMAMPMSAQLFNNLFRTTNRPLIEDALSGVFVRVDQGYELYNPDTDESYGREGKEYFNLVSFLGVQTQAGVILPDEAFTPWANDIDFKDYEGRYTPRLVGAEMRPLTGLDTIPVTEAQLKVTRELGGRMSLVVDTLALSGAPYAEGLMIDTMPGSKSGWMVWVSTPGKLASANDVTLTSIKTEINVSADGATVPLDTPDISENVLGGIYLTPQQTAPGQISFYLTGVAAKDGYEWILVTPFAAEMEAVDEDPIVEELTPIVPRKGLSGNPLDKHVYSPDKTKKFKK